MGGEEKDYALAGKKQDTVIEAPVLPYQPPMPRAYRPKIGLIGCGGITSYHLEAYRRMGLEVVALCDLTEENAEARRKEFYPDAMVCTDYQELLARDDIGVIDAATHPAERAPILEDAIAAGKHLLSQKPFVTDLDAGAALVHDAEARGVRLAVNQNGRWAPHFSYMRHAIAAGLIGEVSSIEMAVHWDHNWVAGTPFDALPHVLFYDFAIHWFDIVQCFMGGQRARSIYAVTRRGAGQRAKPPLVGSASVTYDHAIATLHFAGSTPHGAVDRTVITGTKGTLRSQGPDLNDQCVTLHTAEGAARPQLEGTWFTSGFEGCMGELLCAIEEERAPYNSAAHNLASLELAFAAMASAERGAPVEIGTVRRPEAAWLREQAE